MPAIRFPLTMLMPNLLAVHLLTASASGGDAPSFNHDVRPILSETCFKCHGPDPSHRQADLRLDTEAGVRAAFGDSLDSSVAWERITSADPDMVMPPSDSHLELTDAQKATLRQWIAAGATWQQHWSFIPPERPDVPPVSRSGWVRNPVDAFVLARLEREGLAPSPPADPEVLLRRVHFDLTGLPPSIEEMDAFLADPSDAAFEAVVDRLLASDHYGERMALRWMDAARYGDTSVFHADGPRDMWPWRDWVISAYNANKPFDQFTVEQLAGDLLPDATTSQQVATGFLRNNATTDEGGLIEEEYRVEYAVDRVKTTSMVWLGLSMECAQCHSHKYDPISQEEYYQFYAYFNQAADPGRQTRNGNQAPVVDLHDDQKLREAETLREQVDEQKAALEQLEADAEPAYQAWLQEASSSPDPIPAPADALLHATLDELEGASAADTADDDRLGTVHGTAAWVDGRAGGGFRSDGANWIDFGDVAAFRRTDAFSYGCWIRPAGEAHGAPIARMKVADAYRGWDLHCSSGHVEVHIIHVWPNNAIKVRTKQKVLKPDAWQHIFVMYDGSGRASGVTIHVDGTKQEWNTEQDGLSGDIRTDAPLTVARRDGGSEFRGVIDDVRIFERKLSDFEIARLAGTDTVTPLLALPAAERTAEQQQALRDHFFAAVHESWPALAAGIAGTEARIAELEQPVVDVMVMRDVDSWRPTFVLDRGNYASPRDDMPVSAGVPAVFPPPQPSEEPGNRLQLARWLVQDNHPLTARVAVNRHWAMLFGSGLVQTVGDFGSQGAVPSHPALLDWLAVDFREHGWDVKRLLKQLVMSSTYRQSSHVSPELLKRDPQNRLLARGARFRLSGEAIRDNALAASGLLVRDIGGPGVKPYQPPGLWNEVSLSGDVRFEQDHGDKLYRRSLYTYWKRSAPAPAMTIFDAPTREKCVLSRSRTNTPLQALVTMNDIQFMEAARCLAERCLPDSPDNARPAIQRAFRLATGCTPSERTLALLDQTWREERETFGADTERALQLISIGESPRDESLAPADHAAMTVVASIILNLDATVTRN